MATGFAIYSHVETKKQEQLIAEMERIQVEERRAERAERERVEEIKREDDASWNLAWQTNSIEAFEHYISTHSNGQYVRACQDAIAVLSEQHRQMALAELEYDVIELARKVGDDIIRKNYGDGVNKHLEVTHWDIVDENELQLNVRMTWNGDWRTTKYYEAHGHVTVDIGSEETTYAWSPSYINPTLAQYTQDVNETSGAVLATAFGIALLSEIFSN